MDIRDVKWPGWEVVEEIGSGSYGNVYKIRRTLVNIVEYAALKIITIPKNTAEIDDLIDEGYARSSVTEHYKKQKDDIVREYELMASLKGCPNIVHAEDISIVQQSNDVGWDIYIKMELLTPLKRVARSMQESDIIKLGMDICNALMVCKKNNVIHRDIKPANLFVSDTGVYKLGDFGVAKTAAKTQRGTYAGTEQFMAPEVAANKEYGTSVDIYSLGLVMYWLLNNRRFPFVPQGIVPVSEEEQAKNRRLSGEAIPEPENGSRELKSIVLKACAFEPRARFESAEAMYYALAGVSEKASAPRSESVKVDQRFVDYDDGFSVGTYGASTSRSDATVSGGTLRGASPVGGSTVRETTERSQSTVRQEAPKQEAPKAKQSIPVQSMDRPTKEPQPKVSASAQSKASTSTQASAQKRVTVSQAEIDKFIENALSGKNSSAWSDKNYRTMAIIRILACVLFYGAYFFSVAELVPQAAAIGIGVAVLFLLDRMKHAQVLKVINVIAGFILGELYLGIVVMWWMIFSESYAGVFIGVVVCIAVMIVYIKAANGYISGNRIHTAVKNKNRTKKLGRKNILAIILVIGAFAFAFLSGFIPDLFRSGVDVYESIQVISVHDSNVTVSMLEKAEKKLEDVKGLEFSFCTFDDDVWTYISNCQTLESITFSSCDITNEEFSSINFAEMTQLVDVQLTYNDELTDISPLYVIGGQIKSLYLERNGTYIPESTAEGLGAVDGLQAFPNLEELELRSFYLNNHYISNVEPIASLTTLKRLCITSYTKDYSIADITPLKNLTELVELTLCYNQFSDISALSSLTKLERLDLSGNKIQDINALKELVNLTYLNIGDNEISDITSLENMTKLEALYIYGNSITSLNGLENALNLYHVDARNMETLTDLSALEDNGKADVLELD